MVQRDREEPRRELRPLASTTAARGRRRGRCPGRGPPPPRGSRASARRGSGRASASAGRRPRTRRPGPRGPARRRRDPRARSWAPGRSDAPGRSPGCTNSCNLAEALCVGPIGPRNTEVDMDSSRIAMTMVLLLPIVGTIGLFVFLAVATWSRAQRREREAFHRAEVLRKLAELPPEAAAPVLAVLREDDARALRRRREGLVLAGLIWLVVGVAYVGVGHLVAELAPRRPVGVRPDPHVRRGRDPLPRDLHRGPPRKTGRRPLLTRRRLPIESRTKHPEPRGGFPVPGGNRAHLGAAVPKPAPTWGTMRSRRREPDPTKTRGAAAPHVAPGRDGCRTKELRHATLDGLDVRDLPDRSGKPARPLHPLRPGGPRAKGRRAPRPAPRPVDDLRPRRARELGRAQLLARLEPDRRGPSRRRSASSRALRPRSRSPRGSRRRRRSSRRCSPPATTSSPPARSTAGRRGSCARSSRASGSR